MLDDRSLVSEFIKNNYSLRKLDSQLKLAEAELEFLRDKKKDKADIVLSLGQRNRSGDTATGGTDETDTVGSIRLEYQNALDKTGFDAERQQAQIERKRLLQTIEMNKRDIEFDAYGLIAEIRTGIKALQGQKKRKKVETEKLKDAHKRFKIGRTDTDQIIQFERELLAAELAVEQKNLEIQNKLINLNLKAGAFWSSGSNKYNAGGNIR